MKNTNKFYQRAAAYMVSKNIHFSFKGSYISANNISISNDATDHQKIWIEFDEKWTAFTDLKPFTAFLKRNI